MEIERKFLINTLPDDLDSYPAKDFIQGYLCTDPVLRVRKEGDEYVVTYKGQGLLAREEHNLPLNKEGFLHLLEKADGIVINKKRYFIPERDGLTIELDVFGGELSGLVFAEVEFDSEEAAKAYEPPAWFGREVTYEKGYSNAAISKYGMPDGADLL